MRLWMIQTVAAWEALQKQTVLWNERRFLWGGNHDAEVLRAYDWLCEQMEQRVAPRPFFRAYPLWAWAQWDGACHPRLDLRVRGHLPPGAAGVRLEIEIPEERVLLSDFTLWTYYALNYWYLPKSLEDDQWFEHCCAKKGMDFYRMRPLSDSVLHERLLASWEKIFDLAWLYEQVTNKRKEDKSIQATFWTLHVEEVQSAHPFRAH